MCSIALYCPFRTCLTKNHSFISTLVKQLVVVISFTTHIILSKATVQHDYKCGQKESNCVSKTGPMSTLCINYNK